MNIEKINKSIQTQKTALLQHTLYQKVQTIEDLQCFVENHVYAVWDFRSLLKALQSKLTCTTTPWVATKNHHDISEKHVSILFIVLQVICM